MLVKKLLFLLLIFALGLAACGPEATPTPVPPTAEPEPTEEAVEEPVEEATAEAVVEEEVEEPVEEEATPEAVVEAVEEEATPEVVVEAVEEEATPEAVVEAVEEEATPEAVVEAVEEEATPEAVVEAVEEEATPEAVVEAVEEEVEEFVFGMVLVGPRNDRGWSQAHYEGGQYVEEKLPGARMLVFESLNPASAPETTLRDVVTEMVDQGAKLIFTASDEFEEDTAGAAPEFPDVVFINISGDDAYTGEAPDNLGNIMGTMEWGKLIAGCAAGMATETGQIGYLGPLINFETRRLTAAAYLGAQYCYEKYAGGDPDELQFTVTWIGFWFNIPGVTLDPTEVVNTFYDGGVDVVISGIDTTESLVVAGQRAAQGEKVWAVPYDYIGACDEAPDICLGVPYFHWGPAYLEAAAAVKAGTYEQAWTLTDPDWADINDPDTSGIGFIEGPGLSEEHKAHLDEFIADMAAFATDPDNAGNVFLWVGPLNYQDGTQLVGEGEALPYIAPLGEAPSIWYLEQLLEGMIGPSTQD